MNLKQKFTIVVCILSVSLFMHTYYCEWCSTAMSASQLITFLEYDTDRDTYIGLLKLESGGKLYRLGDEEGKFYLFDTRLRDIKFSNESEIPEYEGYRVGYGIAKSPGLINSNDMPGLRIAFYYGLIAPLVLLFAAVFVYFIRTREERDRAEQVKTPPA